MENSISDFNNIEYPLENNLSKFSTEMGLFNLHPAESLQSGTHYFVRFDVEKPGDQAGYYKIFDDESGNLGAVFGSLLTGTTYTWVSHPEAESVPEKFQSLNLLTKINIKNANKIQNKFHDDVADSARKDWYDLPEATDNHPYLEKMKVKCFDLLKAKDDHLVIPIMTARGEFRSHQTIHANGTKSFLPGGEIKGNFYTIHGSSEIVICEDYATGASIHMATGAMTVIAFRADNLEPVAKKIREKDPGASIIIASDEDGSTDGNPRKEQAISAAKAINAKVIFPDFCQVHRGVEPDKKITTFNDLHTSHTDGLDLVRIQLEKVFSNDIVPEFPLISLGDIEDCDIDWVVEGLLDSSSVTQIFGDPGSCKSFIAMELAACVASGTDFHGRPAKQGLVIYIAGEGLSGIKKRFKALSLKYDIDLVSNGLIQIPEKPADLCDQVQLEYIIKAIDLKAKNNEKPALIVIDTVARNFGSGDENSTTDMNKFVQSIDKLKARYNSAVLLVHHSGHASKERGRGSTVLKGALDAEYKVTKNAAGVVNLENTKMKDHEPPEPMAFNLLTVELGVDGQGNPITSAVLELIEYATNPNEKDRFGKWESVLLNSLTEMYEEFNKEVLNTGLTPNVEITSLRQRCTNLGMNRQNWGRSIKSLQECGEIIFDQDYAYLNSPNPSA